MTVNLSLDEIKQRIAYLSGNKDYRIQETGTQITIFFPPIPITWSGKIYEKVNTIIFKPSRTEETMKTGTRPVIWEKTHRNPEFFLLYNGSNLDYTSIDNITIFDDILKLCFPPMSRSVRAHVDSGQASDLERRNSFFKSLWRKEPDQPKQASDLEKRVEALEKHVVDLMDKFAFFERKFNARLLSSDKQWMAMDKLLDIVHSTH